MGRRRMGIEAATGLRREHDDTDISILSCDVTAFVEFMAGPWHVWNNVGGVFHPLGDRWMTVDEPRSQLWMRADARSPWILDIPLTPDVDGLWSNKRVPTHIAPVEEVTWRAADGILSEARDRANAHGNKSSSEGRPRLRRDVADLDRRQSAVAGNEPVSRWADWIGAVVDRCVVRRRSGFGVLGWEGVRVG